MKKFWKNILAKAPWLETVGIILCFVLVAGFTGYKIREQIQLNRTVKELSAWLSENATENSTSLGTEVTTETTSITTTEPAMSETTTTEPETVTTTTSAAPTAHNSSAHASADFGNDELAGTIFVTQTNESDIVGQLSTDARYSVHLRIQNISDEAIENLKLYFPDLKTPILVPNPDDSAASPLKFTLKYNTGGGQLNGEVHTLEAELYLWSSGEGFYADYVSGSTKICYNDGQYYYTLDDVELFSESFGSTIGVVKTPNTLANSAPTGRLENGDEDNSCEITFTLSSGEESTSGGGIGTVLAIILIGLLVILIIAIISS